MGRMHATMMRPHTLESESYHVTSRMYIVVLVVVLSSIGTCDLPPDHNQGVSTLSVVNACDTDQLEVTTNPVHINASTHETYCSFLVNAPNSTAISVSVLNSGINNVSTYFYIELLQSQIPKNSKRIKLISLDNYTSCVTIIQGNQLRFYFQNTNITLKYATKKLRSQLAIELCIQR